MEVLEHLHGLLDPDPAVEDVVDAVVGTEEFFHQVAAERSNPVDYLAKSKYLMHDTLIYLLYGRISGLSSAKLCPSQQMTRKKERTKHAKTYKADFD